MVFVMLSIREYMTRRVVSTFLFIAAIIALSRTVQGGQLNVPCPHSSADDSLASLQQLSSSLPPVLTPTQFGDVSDFCRVNGLRDYEGFGSLNDRDVRLAPWMGGFIAASDQREEIWKRYSSNQIDGQYNPKDEPLLTAGKIQAAEPLSQNQIAQCDKEIERKKNTPIQQGDEAKAALTQGAFLCKDVTFMDMLGCAKSLQDNLALVQPHGDTNLIDVWKEVLKDPIYIRVMKKVALRNLALIENRKIPESHFFDDLKDAFFTELHDKNKATDHTFNLLGVLASNGVNSDSFIPCKVSIEIRSTILALNLGSMVLDRRTAEKGFLYSYPKEVNSLCDYGKNYHFWMAAFLARYGAKKTGNVTASAAAAYTMDKGYQFMKEGIGRDRTKAFTENAFSNYNNNMRLDLTQSAAGAWYGATSVNANAIQISRKEFELGLKKLFEGSKMLPRDPDFFFPSPTEPRKMIGTYSKWKQIINPDAAYKYFETLIKH
jgi:hypothetical protein